MLPWFSEQYGNAGSVGHPYGELAAEAVQSARATIARAVHASADEIVFTSGATESNNLAIRGAALHRRRRGNHLVSVATEHRAVLDPLRRLRRDGYEVTLLDVQPHGSPQSGWLDPAKVASALREETVLVSVMLANNEIGVIQPLADIAACCRDRGVLLHCDATQAVGKIPVDVAALGVDLMSFSAHKLYGPKGVGALYVRSGSPRIRLEPLIFGGGQESGLRSGTLNVPGIIGFAKAITLCLEENPGEAARLAKLRDDLAQGLIESVGSLEVCGPALEGSPDTSVRLPGNLMISTGDVDGEAVQMRCPGLAFSTGAACSSAEPGPSHVLRALGMTEDAARSSLRFGLGRFTTDQDIAAAVEQLSATIFGLRNL